MNIPLIENQYINYIEKDNYTALQSFKKLGVDETEEKDPVLTIQKKYDPYQVPPDWMMAEEHHQAMRIAKPICPPAGQPIDVDEMSGRPIFNNALPLCCDYDELNFLGPSFSLYFQFYLFTFRILIAFLFIFGFYALYSNHLGHFCNAELKVENALSTDVCVNYTVLKLSLANKLQNKGESLVLYKLLTLIAYVVVIFLFQYFRYQQRKQAQECDDRDWTPADFTVEVRNLPPPAHQDANVKADITEWFRIYSRPGKYTDVARVNLAYDITTKLGIEARIEELQIRKRKELAKNQDSISQKTSIEEIDSQIDHLQKLVNDYEKDFTRGVGAHYMQIAFVTFNKQDEYWEVLENFQKQHPLSKIIFGSRENARPIWDGHEIKVRPADEPSDVFWQNLAIPTSTKIRNRVIGHLISAAILVLSFYSISQVNIKKKEYLTGKQDQTMLTTQEKWIISLIGGVATCIVIGINSVLRSALKRICSFEKYDSWTDYYMAFAARLSWAQFFNTGGITLVLAILTHNYWGIGGLILSIHQVFVFSAFLTPATRFINISYHARLYQRRRAMEQGENSLMTQKEANQLFEDFACDFAEKYSCLIKSMFVAALYAPILPMALVWTIIGNFLMYYVDKYNILRRSSIGKSLGATLALEMTEVLEWFLIIFGVSNFFFNTLFFGEVSLFEISGLLLAISNAFLPMHHINVLLFGKIDPLVTDDTYEDLRLYFEEDYDRCNPATQRHAIEEYSKEVQSYGNKEKYHTKFMNKFFGQYEH